MSALEFSQLLGNYGEFVGAIVIVVTLIYLAVQVRQNTASVRASIFQASASNWMHINGQMASNRDLAAMVEKALSGGELDAVESRQFRHWVSQHLTHGNMMLRFYDEELISEGEVRRAFRASREHAQFDRFRQQIEAVSDERLRGLILDENGLDRWLNRSDLTS